MKVHIGNVFNAIPGHWKHLIQHPSKQALRGSLDLIETDAIPEVVFQICELLCPFLEELSQASFPPPMLQYFKVPSHSIIINMSELDSIENCMKNRWFYLIVIIEINRGLQRPSLNCTWEGETPSTLIHKESNGTHGRMFLVIPQMPYAYEGHPGDHCPNVIGL